jgi:hypothetical protein
LLLLAALAAPVLAQVNVPAGSTFALNGGNVDLGSTSLQVGGTFALGSGNVLNVDSISILNGGILDGGSGSLNLFGDWSDTGTFNAGTGSVNFVDGGTSQSNIGSDSSFNNVSFVSTSGKNYLFAVGSTQSVSGALTILGTPAQGIQFRSSTAGQVANIDLLARGSQNIQYVGVSDVHAIGQHLAPNQTNDGGTGNDTGWFGTYFGVKAVPAPTLSAIALLLLTLLLAISSAFALPTRQQG